MEYGLKTRLLDYFQGLQKRGVEEGMLLLALRKEVEYYDIASVSAGDLAGRWEAGEGEGRKMELLARKMGDAYVENGFWGDIDSLAEECGFKKINKS